MVDRLIANQDSYSKIEEVDLPGYSLKLRQLLMFRWQLIEQLRDGNAFFVSEADLTNKEEENLQYFLALKVVSQQMLTVGGHGPVRLRRLIREAPKDGRYTNEGIPNAVFNSRIQDVLEPEKNILSFPASRALNLPKVTRP